MTDLRLGREDFASEEDWQRARTVGGTFDLPARRGRSDPGKWFGPRRVFIEPQNSVRIDVETPPVPWEGRVFTNAPPLLLPD